MELSPALSFTLFVTLTVSLGVLWMCDATVQVNRPRGVSLSNEPLYNKDRQGEWFTCLDGSLKIPRSQLNDNYCDCPDSSDEPGTSACPNGRFHCNNRGFRPMYIPSSRVNDGICDCCDASDEYEGPGAGMCVNNCKELGKKDLEDRRQQMELFNQGFELRQEYIKSGNARKAEREESLKTLRAERQEAQTKMDEAKKRKDEAEAPEKEAMDKHKAAWDAEVAAKKAAEERERALQAFQELDINSDGKILFHELSTRTEFDSDSSGDVNEEEAKNALGGFNYVDEATFIEQTWNSIKDTFKFAHQLEAERAAAAAGEGNQPQEGTQNQGDNPATFDEFPEDNDMEDNYDDIEEEDEWADDEERDEWADDDDDDEVEIDEDTADDVREARRKRRLDRLAKRQEERKNANGEDQMPEYDEATKALIAAANKARDEDDEAGKALKNLDRSIGDIEKQLKVDLGPEQEFQELQGECYEYSDREYTYKLCPFEKSTQRSKNGGSETSLGRWNQWEGPADNKYSAMTYTSGQKCWNGPDRSTKVILSCGTENRVTSASEPDRCVYQFGFTTPALCTSKFDLSTGETDTHDEL